MAILQDVKFRQSQYIYKKIARRAIVMKKNLEISADFEMFGRIENVCNYLTANIFESEPMPTP